MRSVHREEHPVVAIENKGAERLHLLINAYGAVLAEREFTRDLFGVI